MRILFFGDVVGHPGRRGVAAVMPRWVQTWQPDVVIANGENIAHGMGITADTAQDLFDAGVDLITLGNHTFRKKETAGFLDTASRVIRPANYPSGAPGQGYAVIPVGSRRLAVVNLLGRVFMDPVDDPFRGVKALLPLLKAQTPCIVVDMHAEATSEKAALAWMLDGQVSAVLGTHTHVATADARVLPGGTAFLTDIGMVGPRDSVLGVRSDVVIERFLTWLPARFEPAGGSVIVSAVCLDVDDTNGRATTISRVEEILSTQEVGQ